MLVFYFGWGCSVGKLDAYLVILFVNDWLTGIQRKMLIG